MANKQWTKPFYGVTHLNGLDDKYRVTVVEYKSCAELDKWYPGCGFNPITEDHPTTDAAKKAGESWLK